MQAFLLLMVCGNTLLKWNSAGFLVKCVNAIYRIALNTKTQRMTRKLKEKMINKREPITDVIIKANSDIGKPIITARFLIFLYTSYFFIIHSYLMSLSDLDYDAD